MATTYDTTGANYIISGTNASITQVTTYDAGSFFVGWDYPLVGIRQQNVICTRIKVEPTKKVKSVSLTVNYQNKAHGNGEFVTYYAKVSTASDAWPATYRTTSNNVIGQLTASTGSFDVDISFTATASAFYVYIWGYLNPDSVGEHDINILRLSGLSCVKGGVNLYVKTGASTWKQASAVYVKINSTTWKEVTGLYAKTNSTTWKEAT